LHENGAHKMPWLRIVYKNRMSLLKLTVTKLTDTI